MAGGPAMRELRQARYDLRRLTRQLENAKRRAATLEEAIREHHRQVVDHENWGADDDLWAVLKIGRRPETYSAERRAA